MLCRVCVASLSVFSVGLVVSFVFVFCLKSNVAVFLDSLLLIALSDVFNIYLYKIIVCVKVLKEVKTMYNNNNNGQIYGNI